MALSAVVWSTTGVLQRQLSVDIPTQVAGRAGFAALGLLVYVAFAKRGRVAQAWRSIGLAGLGLAGCLAITSASFVVALNYATVARVFFIAAITPAVAALLARVLLGEPLGRRTVSALVLALAGVTIMVGRPDGASTVGDVLALAGALAAAVSLVIVRHRRDVTMAPATCLGQLLVFALVIPFAQSAEVAGDLWALALGGGQVAVGLALMTVGARLLPAAQVGLISMLELLLAPLWVWLALDERPSTSTLVGGAVVIAAIGLQTAAAPRGPSEPRPTSGAGIHPPA